MKSYDNARVIAAAPDLLRAAKLALDVLAVEYEGGKGIVNAQDALHVT